MPRVKDLPAYAPIDQQLPKHALNQHKKNWIGNEEPFCTSSAMEEVTHLCTRYANKNFELTIAPRVIYTKNKYDKERRKFEQMQPLLAEVVSLLRH